jgi:hypothetical protein
VPVRYPSLGAADVVTTQGTILEAKRSIVEQLQRQINRYTMDGGAPVHLRIGAAPLPVTGTLDYDTALRSVWIMQMRAGMTKIQWNDGASQQLLNEAMSAYVDPRAFVEKNLERVVAIITLFANKNGIPGPKSLVGATPTLIIGAITIGALALIFIGGK